MVDVNKIKKYSQELGIDQIRITTAEPNPEVAKAIHEQRAKGLYTERQHHHLKDITNFCNYQNTLPEAKTIITACQCYLTNEKDDLSEPGDPHGLIARYTWRNHYLDLKHKLRRLAQSIQAQTKSRYKVFSNGPIAEKPLAVRSGIGFFGKHSIVINQTYGSWIVLGEIILDIELTTDEPLNTSCEDCQKCIEACPTGAIVAPYIINRRRCIQELTNWLGVLPHDIAQVWGKRLYGCTVCQDVCPFNKKVLARKPFTELGFVGPSISLSEILNMSESEYRNRFNNNQITARWIHFKAIQRNALVCLGNIKDPKTRPLLEQYSRHQDEILSRTAQWAIDNF